MDQNLMSQDDVAGVSIDYAMYAILIAMVLMIVALIVKLLRHDDDHAGAANENTGLLTSSKEDNLFRPCSSDDDGYGTMTSQLCGEEDSESLSCQLRWLDLYDPKICVICYDQLRNCIFTPCGHSVSCINCTDRIMSEEMKSCPICRTSINQVHRLHSV